jgi:hypothetical protein
LYFSVSVRFVSTVSGLGRMPVMSFVNLSD